MSHWDTHNLSQWDRQIGTGCACFSGTGTLLVPNLSHWDRERSKETCPCPMDRSHPTLETCPCRRTGPVPTMEPVPVQPVPTCPTKWDYKAVETSQQFQVDG